MSFNSPKYTLNGGEEKSWNNRPLRQSMTELVLSDEDLRVYRTSLKQVTNPRARWLEKNGHRQKTFTAKALDTDDFYQIYIRQNLNDWADFSCGLVLITKGGKRLTLIRYNGANHVHKDIRYSCHIHVATATEIRKGSKPERQARETTRYTSIDGAFACMIDDCGILGINSKLGERDLFDGT